MGRRLLVSAAGIAVAAVIVATGGIAHAQGNNTKVNAGNGLRISPVRNELTVAPGTSKTIDIYLQNITGAPAKFKGVVNDFIAADDETGQPRVLLDDDSKAPSHGLKGYVADINEVELQPQEQKIIKVTITMPSNAAGGGYFGAVRFLPASVDSSTNISLSASVASLLLVTVPGDIKEQASVASFNVSRENGKASNFFVGGGVDDNKKGLQTVIRIKNSGNIQVSPFGKFTLKKNGKVISTYELNDTTPRGNVLPDSVRRFTVDMGDKTKSVGKYSIEGNFGYGTKGQLINAKTSFYVVPLPYLLVGVGLLLVLIAALLILPRMLKSHDRKLIRRIRSNRGK